MPTLTQGSERYRAIANASPIVQKAKDTANSFPVSSCIHGDYTCLPPLYLLPSLSSQSSDGFYKKRGVIALNGSHRRGLRSWNPGSLRALGEYGGAEEVGAVGLKKYNRCSSQIPFPKGSKLKPGYCFRDPVSGATPRYLQRLSQLATLECKTIRQEKNRKLRRTKKPDNLTDEGAGSLYVI